MTLLDIMERPYPHSAGFKATDTSRAAAETINAACLRAKVLDTLRQHGPLTADEAADRLRIDRLSIRPRLSELKATGRVRDTGERRLNASKKRAIVWRLA